MGQLVETFGYLDEARRCVARARALFIGTPFIDMCRFSDLSLRLDTSQLGLGSLRANIWLVANGLGSGWLVLQTSLKNGLGPSWPLDRSSSTRLASHEEKKEQNLYRHRTCTF
jgi:hypothetical protein